MKKESLFAQRMGLEPREEENLGEFQVFEVKETALEVLEAIVREDLHCSETGFPQTLKIEVPEEDPLTLEEFDASIHEQNIQTISKMSQKQLEQAYNEIYSQIPNETIEILKKRGKKKQKCIPKPPEGICTHKETEENEEEDQRKFDSEGKISEEGFSLGQVLQMTRSVIPSQRSAAFKTLLSILQTEDEAIFKKNLEKLEEKEFWHILILGMTDPNLSTKRLAFEVLHYLLHKDLDFQFSIEELGFVYSFSKENGLLPDSIKQKKFYYEEEENRTKWIEEQSNQGDLISNLLKQGLLNTLPHTIETIDILLALALHSVTACFYIVNHKELIHFIPQTIEYKRTFELLSVLVRSSVLIAHRIKHLFDIETPILKELTSEDKCKRDSALNLVYSLYCHNEKFEFHEALRVTMFEMLRTENESANEIFQVAARMVETFENSKEYQAFFELGVYKYLEQKPSSGLLKFLRVYVTYQPQALQILKENLTFFHPLEIPRVSIDKNTENFISLDDWENFAKEDFEFFYQYLLILNKCDEIGIPRSEELVEYLMRSSSKIQSIFENFVSVLDEYERYPRLLIYRIKPLVYSSVALLEICDLLGIYISISTLCYTLPFLGCYSEFQLQKLLSILENRCGLPEFYLGFLSSEKHLKLSEACFSGSTKIGSMYLSNRESEFLPVPVNWSWIPLLTEPVEPILRFINELIPYCIPSNIYLAVKIFNKTISETDSVEWENLIRPIGEALTELSSFEESTIKCIESVEEFIEFYTAESYLQDFYTDWLMVFLRDETPLEVYKKVLSEIKPFLSRIAHKIPVHTHSRLLSNISN